MSQILKTPLVTALAAAVLFGIQSDFRAEEKSMTVPQTVFEWTRKDGAVLVDSANIFKYMDGAGELYLGYRFDRLEAFAYRAAGRPDILLEVYRMKTSDDAFGLLSLDWSGEPVPLDEDGSPPAGAEAVPPIRALYGSGLLRVWSGNLYLRVLADLDTPEARRAVIALGNACVRGRKPAALPGWMKSLPPSLCGCGAWEIEKDQVRFLRTHLVLNSVYFLGYSNILGLDLSAEIAAARYRAPQKTGDNSSPTLLNVRYRSAEKAAEALNGFHAVYYPDMPLRPGESAFSGPVVRSTEGKWSGVVLSGPVAVLGFEFPDGASVEKALIEAVRYIENQTGGQP